MEKEVGARIAALRKLMSKRGIDAYLIPTADYHGSEYVDGYFKTRRFITGFTGSAGTAVITMEEAGLWTDGRYFVQADKELSGSGIKLFKMGREGVPTIEEYLLQAIPEGGVLGFDGRVVSEEMGEALQDKLGQKGICISFYDDLVGELWEDRPELPKEPVWILKEEYAGRAAAEKIADLRREMTKKKAQVHILTSLDDIIWLLNIRGNDVPNTPVVLSYLIVTLDEILLFINRETLNEEVTAYLQEAGVRIYDYDDIYQIASSYQNTTVMLEKSHVNYTLCQSLNGTVTVIDVMNPTSVAKAIKNPTEISNMRKAHIKDGVAMVKFMYWLKQNIGKIQMDEMSAASYLKQLRGEQEGNLGLSFATISAYGDNAAMCHYAVTKESNRKLTQRGLYLVDSGGQYYEGTTDITRTFALGELTDEEKECFTIVASCMLRLLNIKFPYGCRGYNFDFAARELLWKRGLDFNHGTGHGVSYLGSVHERPNGVRWRVVPERQDNAVFEEGMVTSNEPGLYFEGKFGIRTENLMICVKAEKNEYGQFMEFENLTWVPIDLDAIDVKYMEPRDRELLNRYHREVYEKISPYLTKEESGWLRTATREI